MKNLLTTHDQHAGMIFFFSIIVYFLLVRGCMLPKLDEIHSFQTLRLKENYFFVATCRVTPFQNCFQAFRGQKLSASYDSYEYRNIVFRIQGIFPYLLEVIKTVQPQPSLFGSSELDRMGSGNYRTAPLVKALIQNFQNLWLGG